MRGRIALRPEVVDGPHQPFAEALLPEAVHLHPPSQGMRRGREPAGETEAVAWRVGGKRRQARRNARLHDFARLIVLTAL